MHHNPSDDDNDRTDDPEYWEDGEDVLTCPWCGSIVCGSMDLDGNIICTFTRKMIP